MCPPVEPARYRAGVTGHPIAHSKSPKLHTAAYSLIGFDCSYSAIDTPPSALAGLIAELRSDAAWRGLSVTMPHKGATLPLLDELGPDVAALGVVNTVVPVGTGTRRRLIGYNTDVAGIVNAVMHVGTGPPDRAVILGGGGTASAAVAALARLGVARVIMCVRSVAKARPLIRLGEQLGIELILVGFDEAASQCAQSPLVISTLPPYGADEVARTLERLPQGTPDAEPVLLDVAYDPWPSELARAWSSRGGIIVAGLEMLLYQAVEQVKLFAGDQFRDEPAVINVMCDAVGAPRR